MIAPLIRGLARLHSETSTRTPDPPVSLSPAKLRKLQEPLLEFGTCCTLDVAKDERGLRVRNETHYWLVAQTNEGEKDTRMEWYLSTPGIEGNFAFNDDKGWSEYTAFTSAFAV